MSRLHGYRFGELTVDGRVERRDVIVLPGRVVRDWRRQRGHRLALGDLAAVMDELPQRLVVGTGAEGRMVLDDDLATRLAARGVDVEALATADAVRRYTGLDPATTAAALHLTC